jgi:crossover junction endodeoxyribonuclease RusA
VAKRVSSAVPRLKAVALRSISYRSSRLGAIAAPATPLAGMPSPRPPFPRRTSGPRRAPLPTAALPTAAEISASRLAITLPVPPSVNHQYATVNGRRVLSAPGRAYKDFVAREMLTALLRSPHRAALLRRLSGADLALAIRFHFASPRRRDVDGGLKIAQDALCEALGLNDNRIVEIHLYKHRDPATPRIEVTLTPAGAAAP